MSWNIAQAKQRFSELVKQAADGPQLIYNRDRLVAAVIDADTFTAFQQWRERDQQRTLADEFAELRQTLREENYEVIIPPRGDRANAFADMLEGEVSKEEAHGLPR
jgi:prevent-host-death family protein